MGEEGTKALIREALQGNAGFDVSFRTALSLSHKMLPHFDSFKVRQRASGCGIWGFSLHNKS
jgi:hypothetical protein